MRMKLLVGSLAGITLLASGCAKSASGAGGDLEGSITADGSSTVYPVTQAIAEEFGKEQSAVKVSVGESGTGGGFDKFCRGESDLSDASRPIKDEEAAICTKKGIEYVELKVAIDGLSVLANPQNTWAKCLTLDELKTIWEPKSKVKNWSQVRLGFPNKRITLYGPGTASGTFDYFTKEVVGEEGSSRSDYTASEDDNVLVQGVAGDADALGYFGFAYYEQNVDKLKLVEVDSGTGCIAPSQETIKGGTYKPLSRPLFVYVAKKAAARPEVKAFMTFYLENVSGLLADVGYVALDEGDLADSVQAWQTFAG